MPPLLKDLCDGAPGEGDRNVLSVIDPELDCLLRWPGLPHVSGVLRPADDDCDALLRSVRFVCSSATLVGVLGRALRAAAAAAALREALPDERRLKADAAAVAAFGLAVEALKGCCSRCKRGELARLSIIIP